MVQVKHNAYLLLKRRTHKKQEALNDISLFHETGEFLFTVNFFMIGCRVA